MKILLASGWLDDYTGAELATRDIALSLSNLGHDVALYACVVGPLAAEMRGQGLFVTDKVGRIPFTPDILHLHHRQAAADVLAHFKSTPALFVVHDATAPSDEAFPFGRIRRYVGVDERCCARIARDIGIPRVERMLNAVDLERFRPRGPLPAMPQRAAVFSNYATEETHLPAIVAACGRIGLSLDVIGSGAGQGATHPEGLLPRYDLVFAKARCAIEAMAVGTAVVLCDYPGLGELVTARNFATLRAMNFGAGVLTRRPTPEGVLEEIARYDAADAAAVSALIRSEAGLGDAARGWVALYEDILRERQPSPDTRQERARLATVARQWRLAQWSTRFQPRMERLKQVPGLGQAVYGGLRGLWRAYANRP